MGNFIGCDTYGKPLKLGDTAEVMQGAGIGTKGKIKSSIGGYIFIDAGDKIIRTRGPCVILLESAPEVLFG